MGSFTSGAIVTLTAAIVGALITGFTTLIIPWSERRRRSYYLALRIVRQLDKYALDCTKIAFDDGFEAPDKARIDQRGRMIGVYPEQIPNEREPLPPVYPNDVDWNSIKNLNLIDRILDLPLKAEEAANNVDIENKKGQGIFFERYFEERQLQYARLGVEAHEITKKFRTIYCSLSPRKMDKWNDKPLEIALREKIAKIEQKREQESIDVGTT